MGQWGIKHHLNCKNCDVGFLDKNGEKTSDLKNGKIKNAFCCHRCAMEYRSKSRENDKCKRCKKTRRQLAHYVFANAAATGVSFCNGYCPKCYALRQAYNNDETLVIAHELTQQLKKETTNDIEHQKHGRPSQPSSGCDRRSTEGESRSAASKSDFGSFFADFAIRPTGF